MMSLPCDHRGIPKPCGCRTMGQSCQVGMWSAEGQMPFERSSPAQLWQMAAIWESFHFDSKLAIWVYRRMSHLLTICTSQTNVSCVVNLLGLDLALGHRQPAVGLIRSGFLPVSADLLFCPLSTEILPLVLKELLEFNALFSFQLKMSYYEGHGYLLCPRWPESNVA